MNKKKYHGVVVPAITPLQSNLQLDTAAVERIFLFFQQHGVHSFILGTSGEAPSLPAALKEAYIKLAGRLKTDDQLLYVGISSNCLADSVEWARIAFGEGADVVVCNLPSYYQLPDQQIQKYFEQLAERVGGPLMLYNIPVTTHHSIPLSIIDQLSHHPNVVGIKDSERNEERLQTSLKLWSHREDFSHFLGWAARSGESLLNGGDGLIPSTANIAPGLYSNLAKAAATGDREKVEKLQQLSDELGNSYQTGGSLGESLAALKVLMHKEGLCEPYMMPPL
jgi:dihydrodipicolinate synthase/N-acetylneuraminate lyase